MKELILQNVEVGSFKETKFKISSIVCQASPCVCVEASDC